MIVEDKPMPDQTRQLEFQKRLIERLQNKLDVQLARNATMRAELETIAHGGEIEWGRWQETQSAIFGDGSQIGGTGRIGLRDYKLFRNNVYQVAVYTDPETDDHIECKHLSIKRNDGCAIRDWRDMQRIKNDLVGPEHEGVELFPESRLVDGANQYHIFVLPIEHRWPIGFCERLVSENEDMGVQQRPWSDEQRPGDLQVIDEKAMLAFAGIKPETQD
jgi:hypothetical protein